MSRPGLTFGRSLALLALSWATAATAKAAAPPTVDDLARVGRLAEARLNRSGARWTATLTNPAGASPDVIVHWIWSPAGQRVDIATDNHGRAAVPIATVVIRDGLWYITQNGRHVRCKPFAFPFARPAAMAYFWVTALRPSDRLPPGVVIDPPDGDRVACRRMLDPAAARQVNAVIAEFDHLAAADPVDAAHAEPAMKAQMAHLRDVAAHGVTTIVNARQGIMVNVNLGPRLLAVKDFAWLDQPDVAAVDFSHQAWEDRTVGPTGPAVDPADLIAVDVDATWLPGRPSIDGRVVDVRTGDAWRVPYAGSATGLVAIRPDGRSAVACVEDFDNGGSRPVLIDLMAGNARPLGGPVLDRPGSGTSYPAVSPDGSTVAVLHVETAVPAVRSRIYLIELATGRAMPTGPTAAWSSRPSWLSDGSGLILARADKGSSAVVRLARDGTSTDVRPGGQPVVLRGGCGAADRVLYRESRIGTTDGPLVDVRPGRRRRPPVWHRVGRLCRPDPDGRWQAGRHASPPPGRPPVD